VINSDIGGLLGLMGYIWIVKIKGDYEGYWKD